MQFFEETLSNLKHIFRVVPRAAVYDLHPGYMSTRMALASEIEHKIGVQHHHAHIASCMAENHLRGQGSWRGHGWHWIWDRRQDLGRRISGGGFCRLYAPGTFAQRSCCPEVTRRCGSRGAWRSVTCAMLSGNKYPVSLQCFRGIDEQAGCPGGQHADAAHSDGRDIIVRTALRCRRCAFGLWLRR